MPKLSRYLETGTEVALEIGRHATAHGGWNIRQCKIEVVGELVAQPMNGHLQLVLGHANLSHHIAEPVEGLLQGVTGTSEVRVLMGGNQLRSFDGLLLCRRVDRYEPQAP